MKPTVSRRSFLKLASLLPIVAPSLSGSNPLLGQPKTDADTPNVLILIFDAFSAHDASLYGFSRETTPNLIRFAERATVYHAHYSAGNFTTPGASSILTGTYPWTHRAINHYGTMLDDYANRNVFSQFGNDEYTRIGFTHNLLASILLDHLKDSLEEFVLPNEVALIDYNFSDNLFPQDFPIAAQCETHYFKKPDRPSDSLFLFPILWSIRDKINHMLIDRLKGSFPRGIPGNNDTLYPLEDTIDWVMRQIERWPQPFLAYLHMMPPHGPYRPRKDFMDLYLDGWHPKSKPDHFFRDFSGRQHLLNGQRVLYDQFITYADAEFGRLHDFMEENGFYENTIVIFTSDHGEMFERKIFQHTTPTLFQPIIRVPLLISIPGQTARQDIYTTTSAVDILPTSLHLTGRPIPTWTEGLVLPPYAAQNHPADRSIFIVEAKVNPKVAPLRKATVAMIKGDFKLVYYFGYDGFDGIFELYNLKDDPEELKNLYTSHPDIASELEQELLTKIEEKNTPFIQDDTD